MTELGEMLPPESIDNEYKEFVLNLEQTNELNSILSEAYKNEHFVMNDEFITNFNQNILSTLYYYFDKYLPKYLGNFSTANMNGSLHIGVADNGIVEGIPYYNELEFDQEEIFESISNYIQIDNTMNKISWLRENIQIKSKKLEINPLMIDNHWKNRLDELIVEYEKTKELWYIYSNNYKLWYDEVLIYSRKINDIINDPIVKVEFCEFLLTTSKTEFIPILQKTEHFELLKGDENIPFDEWIILDRELLNLFLTYKNKRVSEIHMKKPIRPNKKWTEDFNYIYFAQRIQNIRHILYNNRFNFYTIEIKFKKTFNQISYYEPRSKAFVTKKRIICNGNPCCTEAFSY